MVLQPGLGNDWHNLMLLSTQTGTIGITLCFCQPKQGTAGRTLCSRQPKRGTAGITLCSRQPKRGTAGIRILQGILAWLFVRKPRNPHGFLRKKPYFCPVEQAFYSDNSALTSAQTS